MQQLPPQLKILYLPIDKIVPNPRNSRTHSEKQLTKLASSIKRFGFNESIAINAENIIIAGHARLEAAKRAGLTEIPTVQLGHLTREEQKAYLIFHNRIALEAGWDNEILKEDLMELTDLGFDLELTGFEQAEIDDFTGVNDKTMGLVDDDDVPEIGAQSDAVTKRGDVWLLDKHRLMCGDSTIITDIEILMKGAKASMVFTDPPYGVNFKQGKFIGRDKQGKDRKFSPILNDDKQGEDLKKFLQECFSNILTVVDVGSIYVWSPPLLESFSVLTSLLDSGWHIQSQIIWNKTPFVIGRADYHWKHEICWYGYKGENHQWHGGRDKSTIWECNKIKSSDLHPTMKPVLLAETACLNSTIKNDIVLDVFGGSGTTLIACEKLSRICYMLELSEQYCDVIVKRWQQFSGKKAVLESTGISFEETSNGA